MALLAGFALAGPGCTLAKPLACAVTFPVYVIGRSCESSCADLGNPSAALCMIGVLAAVGAAGGLVTGVISDINVVNGRASDPSRNWHDPFATNTSARSLR